MNPVKIRNPIQKNVHYVSTSAAVVDDSITAKSNKRKAESSNQEVPLEERLKHLKVNQNVNSKVPKSNNVAQLLIQGLYSRDKNILQTVMCKVDENVIRNTLAILPASVITALMTEVLLLIEGKTLSAKIGTLWLKCLFQTRTSLMASNATLAEILKPVLNVIKKRALLHQSLVKLQGRLSLIVCQKGTLEESSCLQPALRYCDNDYSNSEESDLDDEKVISDAENSSLDDENENVISDSDDAEYSFSDGENET